MELNNDQITAIDDNLKKLSAMAHTVDYLCEDGVPHDDVMRGWQLILWDIVIAIKQVITPETTKA